ncbi:MAG: efflux RND transporter periplasmic adaptor subunit [Fluviicola sp.]
MKHAVIYIALVFSGLFIGWLIFGGGQSNNEKRSKHEHLENDDAIWTCSMHPQIRKSEPGDCPICGMDLIPAETKGSGNLLTFTMSDEAVKIANIQTTIIGGANATNGTLKLSGKIKADETVSSSVVTHVPGRIEKLYVSFTGEKVSKGQKIALIYSPTLITAQRELLEANKVKDSSPSLYNAAVNKLKNWKLSNNQIQSILDSKDVIETFVIYSEYSGIIKTKRVTTGDYLDEGEALYDLQSLSKVWAVFDVYETDISNVALGTPLTFTTSTYPNEEFSAKVDFIDPLIDPSTRTLAVRASISNTSSKLKPDMFISGTIQSLEESRETLLVPKSSVLWTGKRSVVYLKLPNQSAPTFEYREVEIGEAVGESYKVISGLKSGDEVVTNGAFVIDASAQLNNQSSMMNQNLLASDENSKSEEIPDYSASTQKDFKSQLTELLSSYYELKNALVADNSTEAKSGANKFLLSLNKVDMKLLEGDAHMYWMEQVQRIKKSGQKISSTSDLEKQRTEFIELSQAMIRSVKAYGVLEKSFEQYCPMANKSNGASWLSDEEKIRNPYFGSRMLTCGEVTNQL